MGSGRRPLAEKDLQVDLGPEIERLERIEKVEIPRNAAEADGERLFITLPPETTNDDVEWFTVTARKLKNK